VRLQKCAAAQKRGHKFFSLNPPMKGIKNADFFADLKNANCTYAKCTYKKLFQKYMLNWDLAGFFGISFYMCILRRCVLHFLNQQEILRVFVPIIGGFYKKIFLTPQASRVAHATQFSFILLTHREAKVPTFTGLLTEKESRIISNQKISSRNLFSN
jgi:hypothetical protein